MKTNEAKKVSKVMAEMAAQSVNPVMVAVAPIVNKPTEEEPKAEEMAVSAEAEKVEELPKVEEAPKAEAKGKKKPTKKQTAEELQAEIERKTAELQKCLADLERKKKLSNDRSAFMSALDDLDAAEAKLGEEDGFNSPNYKLKFSGGYGSGEIFALSNRFVLVEFIGFMRGRIKTKISEIEMQLISE